MKSINYHFEADDSRKFLKSFFLKKEYVLKFFILVVVAVCINYYASDFNESTILEFARNTIISCILIFIVFYILPYLNAMYKFKSFLRSLSAQPLKIEIKDDGLEMYNNGTSVLKYWEIIQGLEVYGDYVCILWLNNASLVIPERAFENIGGLNAFVELVNNKVERNTSQNKLESIKRYKLLGLLCLVPILGFIVGLVIIFKGIDLKSNLLKIIGLAGVLISIFSNSFRFYNKVEPVEIRNKQYIQIQLMSLVKEIEYYKLVNGNYPDSLSQLNSDDNYVQIIDFSQFSNSSKEQPFNYQNLDSMYILFSSGNDGKPNTEDDVFPKIQTKDAQGLKFKRQHEKTK